MRGYEKSRLTCDVLVLGGGAAGIRAALTAARKGADTVLLTPRPVGEGGSTFYDLSPAWGVLFAEGKADETRFYEQILAACNGCVDPAMVSLLVERSGACFARMQGEGLSFRLNRDLDLVGCFGVEPRGAMLRSHLSASDTWRRQLKGMTNLRVVHGWEAVTLAQSEGRVSGAVAVNARGDLMFAQAACVVLATGGAEGLYEYGFADGSQLGAAYAMAHRLGAPMVNLEFIQFINGTLAPVKGVNFFHFSLCESPRVTNAQGEPFISAHLPPGMSEEMCLNARAKHGPFCVEDDARYFDLALFHESAKGLGVGAVVKADPARLTGARYAPWRDCLRRINLDIAAPMRIYPFCQCFNGGARVDLAMQTAVPGLFACGEAAGGCHGANRMGGSAMMGTQVFGEIAGESAARFAQNGRPDLDEDAALAPFEDAHGVCDPIEAFGAIRRVMQQYAFLERDELGLGQALKALSQVRVNALCALHTDGALDAFRAFNAAQTAVLIVRAMRARRESRGGHYRTDYPERDEAQNAPQPVL